LQAKGYGGIEHFEYIIDILADFPSFIAYVI
jgi:hypothetical protein